MICPYTCWGRLRILRHHLTGQPQSSAPIEQSHAPAMPPGTPPRIKRWSVLRSDQMRGRGVLRLETAAGENLYLVTPDELLDLGQRIIEQADSLRRSLS
jgi:hypothetical protein